MNNKLTISNHVFQHSVCEVHSLAILRIRFSLFLLTFFASRLAEIEIFSSCYFRVKIGIDSVACRCGFSSHDSFFRPDFSE